jgi:hypothetical protein
MKEHTSIVTTVTPETSGIPRASGFNGFLRALPGESGFIATVAGGVAPANLTPASRRQDHTTSPSATQRIRQRAVRVHRIPHSTFVTIAKRPSCGRGIGLLYCCFY